MHLTYVGLNHHLLTCMTFSLRVFKLWIFSLKRYWVNNLKLVKTFYRIMLDPFHTYIKKGKEKEEGL